MDRLFPDKYWAIALPNYGAVIIYSLIFILLGLVFTLSYKEFNTQETKQKVKSN